MMFGEGRRLYFFERLLRERAGTRGALVGRTKRRQMGRWGCEGYACEEGRAWAGWRGRKGQSARSWELALKWQWRLHPLCGAERERLYRAQWHVQGLSLWHLGHPVADGEC